MRDTTTNAGAQVMADEIKAFWHAKGYDVEVWVERIGYSSTMRGAYFGVRSNITNGWPSSQDWIGS